VRISPGVVTTGAVPLRLATKMRVFGHAGAVAWLVLIGGRARRMKPSAPFRFARVLLAAASLATGTHALAQTSPLPSWHDGPARKAIIDFVRATTSPHNPKFVSAHERIATFDQDGTLWVEHPI